MEFSAKDFIQAPYIDCPKCNSKEFGVLSIGPFGYTRRCAACLFPHPSRKEPAAWFPLPKLDKKVIYLDQHAISEMMKAINPDTKAFKKGTIDKKWIELFKKLGRLCKLHLICCPDSNFHHQESLASPYFKANKRMYEHLSHGVTFKDPEFIKMMQIHENFENWLLETKENAANLSSIKALQDELNHWNERLLITVDSEYPAEWIEDLRKEREKIHKAMSELFFKRLKETNKTFKVWYGEEIEGFGISAIDGFFLQAKRQKEWMTGARQPTLDDLAPNFGSRIIIMIMENMRQRGIDEAQHWNFLAQYLGSESIKLIPSINIISILWALLARDGIAGKKTPPNQGTYVDFQMISVLGPYCDAIFVDNYCAELLSQAPLFEIFKPKVFSQNSFNAFFKYLDEIEKSMSQEHYKAVIEVYGEKWEEPFLSMYTIEKE